MHPSSHRSGGAPSGARGDSHNASRDPTACSAESSPCRLPPSQRLSAAWSPDPTAARTSRAEGLSHCSVSRSSLMSKLLMTASMDSATSLAWSALPQVQLRSSPGPARKRSGLHRSWGRRRPSCRKRPDTATGPCSLQKLSGSKDGTAEQVLSAQAPDMTTDNAPSSGVPSARALSFQTARSTASSRACTYSLSTANLRDQRAVPTWRQPSVSRMKLQSRTLRAFAAWFGST
mmetsp:Transcript_32346/g.93178  ORF Transcript_32346/g.93178 Transcript_32346/m.93178 type:complete len:232 (-) Transcript_32346:173-868(-)